MYAIIDDRNDWYAVTDDPKQDVPKGHRIIPREEAVTYSRSYFEPVVPESITRTQGQLALHRAGLLDIVKAAVAASGIEAQIIFDSPTWHRHNPLIEALGAAVGLKPDQIDQLFIAAGKIE